MNGPTDKDNQARLKELGYYAGAIDGDWGPASRSANFEALATAKPKEQGVPPTPKPSTRYVPEAWMPACSMQRIIMHWSAGSNQVSALDKEHYHLIIAGDGTLVRGDMSIKDNVDTSDGRYAAHTLNCNTKSIGVALAAMAGAQQSPFTAGPQPITKLQMENLPRLLADLCRFYNISVERRTVLSHAEVEPTLGIKQKGKWDIAWIPGMSKSGDPITVGDQIRAAVKLIL